MAMGRTRDVLRTLTTLARRPEALAAAAAMRRFGGGTGREGRRHALAPAAVRVERSQVTTDGARGDQTAVTVWFGTGPNLPAPSVRGSSARLVLRVVVSFLGAAALGAMGAIAAHREATRISGAAHLRITAAEQASPPGG